MPEAHLFPYLGAAVELIALMFLLTGVIFALACLLADLRRERRHRRLVAQRRGRLAALPEAM